MVTIDEYMLGQYYMISSSFVAYPKHVVPACKWDHSTLGVTPVKPIVSIFETRYSLIRDSYHKTSLQESESQRTTTIHLLNVGFKGLGHNTQVFCLFYIFFSIFEIII